MRVVLRQLEQYLDQTLGVKVALSRWGGGPRVAPFLRQQYDFWQTQLLGRPCLLMVDKGRQEQAAAAVRKHVAQVQAKWAGEVIYVRGHLTAYNRRRLVEQKLPFVVPGNQMYLPTAGVDFRERFRRQIEAPTRLSPATQVALVNWLLGGSDEPLTPARVAKELGYSAMTMTRAFRELEAAELVEISRHGKERHLRFTEPKRNVWATAQPFLRTPVTKRICIPLPHPAPKGIQAGLTALAHYSMLAAPQRPTMAVYGQDSKARALWHARSAIPSHDPDALEIEVWCYRPDLFAVRGVVDPLSLYLSLRDDEDERVQAALEEMMGKLAW